jgi:hypothetical protein
VIDAVQQDVKNHLFGGSQKFSQPEMVLLAGAAIENTLC